MYPPVFYLLYKNERNCAIFSFQTHPNQKIIKIVRRYINEYADEIRKHINLHREKSDNENHKFNMDEIVCKFKNKLSKELTLNEEMIANYVIKVSYNSLSISKSFAWHGYGDYIIKNLNENSNPKKHIVITELPYNTIDSYEYLGKYYNFKEANEHR